MGSFLRPAKVLNARRLHDEGQLSDEDMRLVEDKAIREVVSRQEGVGLRGITDGEFRRTYFHIDFLEQLDGVSVTYGEFFATFKRDDGSEVGFRPPTMRVTAPIRHGRSIQGADYDFLSSVASHTPKVSIPAPSMLHFRGGRDAISGEVYPDLDMAIHLCRGNFKSARVSQGGYEPVAEILFSEMDVDAFFLEYDDERSGDFAPLRLMRPDKMVVLGLMSSKRTEVDEADVIKQRIDEAGRYVDLDQCSLSHQCGFSSTVHGNTVSEEDQWYKLARTVEIAHDVWDY